MIDYIRRIATSAKLRALLPNAVPFAYNEATGQFVYKNHSGTVRNVVHDAQTNPFSGVDGAVNYVEVALTNAEIKALRATPKTLVAAPGAGKILKFLGAVLLHDYGGTNAFTESTDNMAVKYTDGSGVAVSQTIESGGFVDATADTMTTAEPKIDAIAAATGSANQALVLHNTGDGEFGGNAANNNLFRVKVWYSVITTGF